MRDYGETVGGAGSSERGRTGAPRPLRRAEIQVGSSPIGSARKRVMQPSNSAHSVRCVCRSAQPPWADVRRPRARLLPVTVHVRASDDRRKGIRDSEKAGDAGILLLIGSTSGSPVFGPVDLRVELNPDYAIHTRTLCTFKM